MIIKHKIVMDLDRGDERKYIDAMQDDKYSRDLELILRSNSKAFCPPEGCTVLASYKKPDGQTGMYDTMPDGKSAWSIAGNVLTLRLAPQVCTVAGKVMLTVTLLLGAAELSCFAVCVIVHEGAGRILKSERYINITGFAPQPERAAVGQYIRVLQTDDKGRITAVETAREVAVDGKDGADGKSAYAYAREGGLHRHRGRICGEAG